MKKYLFTCHSCNTTAEHESNENPVPAAREISWGIVFDISDGMKTVNYCPTCFNKAKILAAELKQIIRLEYFHFDCLIDDNFKKEELIAPL